MNGIALFLGFIAATGQLASMPTPAGVKYGWKPEDDRSLSYIVQVTPEIANQMATHGEEILLDIPDFLQGKINRIVWRIGVGDVEREPSQAELQSIPRSAFPNSSPGSSLSSNLNSNGPGSLTNLNSSTGQTVMIDSLRSRDMTYPTSGVGRTSELDSNLPSVPSLSSLAQNYPSPGSRTPYSSQFDTPNSNANGNFSSNGINNFGTKSVLPKQDTLPPLNGPVYGPPLPPGYTGGQVTVTGTPSTFGNNSLRGDDRQNGLNNSYPSNNPIANGNFGNSNPFNTPNSSNSYSSAGNTGYPGFTSSGISTPPNSMYATPNQNSYSTMGNSTMGNSTQPYYPNGNLKPDALSASNSPLYHNSTNYGQPPNNNPNQFGGGNNPVNNNGVAYANNGMGGTNYTANPYGAGAYPQPPYAANNVPMQAPNYGYSGPNPGYGGYGATSGSMMPAPSTSYLASNPMSPVVRSSAVNANQRTPIQSGYDERDYPPSSSPSYIIALLFLFSLVGNVYLFVLLNQLLQRYRTLQASNRGSSSLAI